ncbi:MAG: PilZ domain-containing protein [Nitrospirota bacterium]
MKNVIIAQTILDAIELRTTLFGRGSIKLHTARSSEDILDIHRRLKADLIITEFSFPEMGGVRLCSSIRGEPGLKDVSLIMYCDGGPVFQAACLDAGANAVVQKPVDAFSLFSKISELIVIPQRKDMRVLLRISVEGRQQDASFVATSYNISLSGMLLETKRELNKGDKLSCSFSIAHAEVNAQCLIMRVDRTDEGRFRYGAKFLSLDTKSIVVIEQYVKSRIRP